MNHSLINDLVKYAECSHLNLHSIMVSQSGSIVAEHHWIRNSSHELRSLSKSFTSCAVGIALDEGRFSLEDRIVEFFTLQIPDSMDKRLRHLTVRHLLTMAHGQNEPIMMSIQRAQIAEPDWARYFLSCPLDRMPGGAFVYDTGATYMLSAIIQQVTGQTLREYAMSRLFDPLGVDNPRWDICPMGRTLGGAGLHLTVAELCRFGNMLLNNGRWEGNQLVPDAYLKEATSKQIETGEGGAGPDWTVGYGYQFWMNPHGGYHRAYRGDGADGQFCIVLPELEAVVAITAQESRMQDILSAVWEMVLPRL